jgi:L-cystine transport system permease protein
MISWERVGDYFGKIIVKFPVTLEIVLVSFVAGFILGCILAIIQLKKIPVLKTITSVFTSYIRCTPIICQMFVVYFGGPILLNKLGVDTTNINNIVYVFVAYGLNMGGFMGETIRSSILAIPAGQTEAGRAVGLTEVQTMVHIISPQALRVALPMLGTMFVALFQATALAYMVGVVDMIGKARNLGTIYGHTLEGYICCAIVFSVISILLEQLFNHLNKHLDFGKSKMKKTGKAVKQL